MSLAVSGHALALGEHGQRRALGGGEVHVLAGEPAGKGQLQHQREPLRPE